MCPRGWTLHPARITHSRCKASASCLRTAASGRLWPPSPTREKGRARPGGRARTPSRTNTLKRYLLIAALLADIFDAGSALLGLNAVRRAAFAAHRLDPCV